MASTGFRRVAAVRSVSQAGLDVLLSQIREVVQDLGDRHPRREILQYVAYGHAHAADARLTAPFARLDGNDLAPVHGLNRCKVPTSWTPARRRFSVSAWK